MKHKRESGLVRCSVLIAIAACAAPKPEAAPSNDLAPRPAGIPRRPKPTAWFGTWDADTFTRTTQVPLVAEQLFGWRMRAGCTGPVRFKEEMRLPAPGDWTFAPDELPGTTISADGTTTTTIDYAPCLRGWIEHRWRVAKNDPPGVYVITVEIDGQPTQTFRPRFAGSSD